MWRTLQDQIVTDEAAVDTILNCFYVDDCLKSTASVDEARSIMSSVKQILSKGG